jgi:hypothetical protein
VWPFFCSDSAVAPSTCFSPAGADRNPPVYPPEIRVFRYYLVCMVDQHALQFVIEMIRLLETHIQYGRFPCFTVSCGTAATTADVTLLDSIVVWLDVIETVGSSPSGVSSLRGNGGDTHSAEFWILRGVDGSSGEAEG